MFDKLKDMYNMRKDAQQMQAMLNAEQVMGVSRDKLFSITINGSFEILGVSAPEGEALTKAAVEKGVKEAFTDAQQKIKGVLMQKFKSMA